MKEKIKEIYGERVRVRAVGLCRDEQGRFLLVNHAGLTDGDFWAPPGGGVDFGEPMEAVLIREFQEETGLQISAGKFLFGCEVIRPPLHAVELFFEVRIEGGKLQVGHDPELNIIQGVAFKSWPEITALGSKHCHVIFSIVQHPEELYRMTGIQRL